MQVNRLKILGVGMVKNGCGQSYDGTLFSLSEEWTNGRNWFFAWWYRSIEVTLIKNLFVKNGCGQSGHAFYEAKAKSYYLNGKKKKKRNRP